MPPTHAITREETERPCSYAKCFIPTFWRAVYIYATEKVRLPRCPVHLAKFALTHQIEVPKEAVNG